MQETEEILDESINVLGTTLESCSLHPQTGYYRNGSCESGKTGHFHTVCTIMTKEFLIFSQLKGNDLSTPRPELMFPGLQPGDQWCLNILRWREAYQHKAAPQVHLKSTHFNALKFVTLQMLQEHQAEDNLQTIKIL